MYEFFLTFSVRWEGLSGKSHLGGINGDVNYLSSTSTEG